MGLQVLLSTASAIPTSHLNEAGFRFSMVCPFESFGVGKGRHSMNKFWMSTLASGLTLRLATGFMGKALLKVGDG